MTTIINGSSPSITFSDGSAQTSATRPFQNRIINGQMQIDQRNAGASGTANAYTVDRWGYYGTQSSKGTWQQNAGSVTPPVGFTNYLGFTSSSAYSVTSTDNFVFYQSIEGFNFADLGFGTANAKTITLSFWARSSLTGTFGGVFANYAFSRCYPFTYTISSANTWTQISITIAGDTSGTWVGATNAGTATLQFGLGTGSAFSGTAGAWSSTNYQSATGATSVVGTDGATLFLTGVQLEVGSTATSFDYRPYGTELALCQRYYYLHASGNNYPVMGAASFTTSDARGVVNFPVTMRTDATLSSASGSNYFTFYYSSSASSSCNSLTADTISKTCAEVKNNTSITITSGFGSFVRTANASAFLAFSAEL